jgi:hypothetical protein
MSHKGDRVGAILGSDLETKTLEFLGYGVYDGYLPISQSKREVGGLGSLMEPEHENPHITLDNGEEVWGCECWWGPEEVVREQIAMYEDDGYTITEVRMSEVLTERSNA